MTRFKYLAFGAWAACCLVPLSALAQEGYAKRASQDFPRNVYWGDTHLHSSLSQDSASRGVKNVGPEEAYRFARGEEITADDGQKYRLSRPLDFLVVSDHAEYLGVIKGLREKAPLLMEDEGATRWASLIEEGNISQVFKEYALDMSSETKVQRVNAPEYLKSVWNYTLDLAEKNNRPGIFTALIGYEWTSMPNDGDNYHRVVLFRDGADKARRITPFSAFDSEDPEALWAFMSRYERETKGQTLAIPHNSNLSGGLMFAPIRENGKKFDRRYARSRARWEPLVEITQFKGDSETHPFLSPKDEFADFERWDKANILGRTLHKDSWFKYEYIRSALKVGLGQHAEIGVNPFKFGVIGSTDSHTGLSGTDSDYYLGKFPDALPSHQDRWSKPLFVPGTEGLKVNYAEWEMSTSGLAAVWAKENTRASLFDAMKRKEVYATTGSRITVRLFGGWDYPVYADLRPDYVAIGYAGGVPMGGDLTKAPKGSAPIFITVAAKDPDGANLDRIQIIKGWLDPEGALHEKIYDVALSDDRRVDPETGKAPPVGNTVDVGNASYRNSIGAAQLSATWEDPDFDPKERAFYYARVIEIPKPRWTAYDAKYFELDLPDDVPLTIQDRAYTSPIWYTP